MAIAVVLTWLWRYWPRAGGEPNGPLGDASKSTLVVVESRPFQASGGNEADAGRALVGEAVVLHVTSPGGVPVAEARLVAVLRAGAFVTRWRPDNEGAADRVATSAGDIVVTATELSSLPADYSWAVIAGGFLPELVSWDGRSERVDVVMDPAHAARVVCVDQEGRPVPGVSVALGRGVSPVVARQCLLAVADAPAARLDPAPWSAMETAVNVTGDDGIARFSSLGAHEYTVEVRSTTHCRLDYSERPKLTPPGELRIVMGEVCVAVVSMKQPDRLIGWRALRDDSAPGVPKQAIYSGAAFWRLLGAHPDSCVLTGLPQAGRLPTVRVSALVAGFGRWDEQITLRPIHEFAGPQVVDLPVVHDDDHAVVSWRTDPPLDVVEGVRPPRLLLTGAAQGVSFAKVLDYGGSVRVAAGKVEVAPESESLRRAIALPAVIDLSGGSREFVWERSGALVPLRFSVEPAGAVIGAMDVQIFASDGYVTGVSGYVGAEEAHWRRGVRDLWVVPGLVEARIRRRGGVDVRVQSMIGTGGGVIACPLSELEVR